MQSQFRSVVGSLVLASLFLVTHAIAQAKKTNSTDAVAQSTKDSDESNAKNAKRYQAAIDSAAAAFVEEAKKIRSEQITKLEEARKAATASDNLDEAVRIRDMIRDLEKAPITVPGNEGDLRDKRKLELENERLKTALAKKDPTGKRLSPSEELAKALVNTKWQSLGHKDTMSFSPDGKASGWGGEPGKWTVDPDGTVLIKWAGGLDWTLHINNGFTGAVTVNNKGQGDRLKLLK